MESAVKQRLVHFIKSMHLTQKAFEDRCGMSNGYVANIRKGIGDDKLLNIVQQFPQLNREWLLYGEGEMLKPQPQVVQSNIIGDNNYINGGVCPECGRPEIIPTNVGAPIIPTSVSRTPHIDILEYINQKSSGVERSNISIGDMPITLWHRVRDTSLMPNYRTGDLLGLWAYPKGEEMPIPGKLYAVDTWNNGLIVRYLFHDEAGYRAHSPSSEEYPDFVIEFGDIVRIYRVMIMVRM